MKKPATLLFCVLLLIGCNRSSMAPKPGEDLGTLVAAREGFTTQLVRQESAQEPLEEPPPSLFNIVSYDSPIGKLAAYLTPDPQDGQKRPAIIWMTGGDYNTIGDVWSPQSPDNDQSAHDYRDAGLVMMFPSLRGGNENPGIREGFFGEVHDILAAADYLAQQPYVDPNRIYLGGHSTGGTIVLLVAEYSDRFRAVFSFGPIDNVANYSQEFVPYNTSIEKENRLRAPIRWLHCIKSPVFVFEGDNWQSNVGCLRAMKRVSTSPSVHFFVVPGDHFSILAPVNRLLAGKVAMDTGPTCNITITDAEIASIGR